VDVEGTSETVEKALAVQINSYKVGAATEPSNDRDPVVPAHLVGILHSIGGLNSIQRAQAPRQGDINLKSSPYVAGPVTQTIEPVHADGDKAKFQAALKASEVKLGQSNPLKDLAKGSGITPGITNGYIYPTDVYS